MCVCVGGGSARVCEKAGIMETIQGFCGLCFGSRKWYTSHKKVVVSHNTPTFNAIPVHPSHILCKTPRLTSVETWKTSDIRAYFQTQQHISVCVYSKVFWAKNCFIYLIALFAVKQFAAYSAIAPAIMLCECVCTNVQARISVFFICKNTSANLTLLCRSFIQVFFFLHSLQKRSCICCWLTCIHMSPSVLVSSFFLFPLYVYIIPICFPLSAHLFFSFLLYANSKVSVTSHCISLSLFISLPLFFRVI